MDFRTKIWVSISACMLLSLPCQANDGDKAQFLAETNPVLRITQALAQSKQASLTPHLIEENGSQFFYQLASVRYLGNLSRINETVIVATALLIRSSPIGGDTPPAKGHGFLLFLDSNFNLVSFAGMDFPDNVQLIGDRLVRLNSAATQTDNDTVIADLSKSDAATRRYGFLIDSNSIEYPFSDRIDESTSSEQEVKTR